MKLNRKWLMIMAVVLSLTMATAGTMAYLTDQDADVNTMTLGKVEIVQNEHQRIEKEDGTYEKGIVDDQESYLLEVFEQEKPLLPIVGDPHFTDGITAGWDDTTVRMSQIGSYGGMQVFAGKNAVDKFVTVTNTGKTDAYVRTFVAIEIGSTDGALIGTSHHSVWKKTEIGTISIDGNNYMVLEYNYPGARLNDGSYRHENGILPAGDTTYPSLSQVYLSSKADNEDVEAIDGNGNEKLDIIVLSQAVQADGFEGMGVKAGTTDSEYALNAGFGEPTIANVAEWFGGLTEDDIGSPGDKWPTNDTPLAKPFAKVTTLGANDTLTNKDGDAVVLDKQRTIDTTSSRMGLDVGKVPLDVAYQFQPTMTYEEGMESEYADWHADFVVTANKDIPAYGIGLAGYYDAWCSLNNDKWVMLASDEVIPAGTKIRLVETMGGGSLTVSYEELCNYGNDGIGFLCGAVALEDYFAEANAVTPGTTITVELRLYEATGGSATTETGEYITTGVYSYTFD